MLFLLRHRDLSSPVFSSQLSPTPCIIEQSHSSVFKSTSHNNMNILSSYPHIHTHAHATHSCSLSTNLTRFHALILTLTLQASHVSIPELEVADVEGGTPKTSTKASSSSIASINRPATAPLAGQSSQSASSSAVQSPSGQSQTMVLGGGKKKPGKSRLQLFGGGVGRCVLNYYALVLY